MRVMKARGESVCPMCRGPVRVGQQIGRTPVGWSHVRCIIAAAQKIAAVTRPGMVRVNPAKDHPATGGATKKGTP